MHKRLRNQADIQFLLTYAENNITPLALDIPLVVSIHSQLFRRPTPNSLFHPLMDKDALSHLSTDVFIRCWADKGKADQEDIL